MFEHTTFSQIHVVPCLFQIALIGHKLTNEMCQNEYSKELNSKIFSLTFVLWCDVTISNLAIAILYKLVFLWASLHLQQDSGCNFCKHVNLNLLVWITITLHINCSFPYYMFATHVYLICTYAQSTHLRILLESTS